MLHAQLVGSSSALLLTLSFRSVPFCRSLALLAHLLSRPAAAAKAQTRSSQPFLHGRFILRCLVMTRRFTCYKLSYETSDGRAMQYWGTTELRRGQSQGDACNARLRNHRRSPLWHMGGAEKSSLVLVPAGPVLLEENCLAQEAIFCAAALASDSTAKGSCFCTSRLTPAQRTTAEDIRRICRGLCSQGARRAVIRYAATLAEDHPLSRRMRGLCFACGGRFRRCSCKTSASEGSVGPAMKSRSGTSLSGAAKRKRLGLTAADPRYARLKWGVDALENRRADNRRQNARSPGRSRGKQSSSRPRSEAFRCRAPGDASAVGQVHARGARAPLPPWHFCFFALPDAP